ncbi:MAG: MBL fold metallo-hydrolase [Bdellovibrionales bacterium]
MKIHVLSGGRFVPLLAEKLWSRHFLPCNCLIIEIDNDIHLVDTGLHPGMINNGISSQIYHRTFGLKVDRQTSLKGQLENLNFNAQQVKTITLTHLHPDHTAGLIDFPQANLYVSQLEWDYVHDLESDNYYAKHFDKKHWSHVKKINLLEFQNEKWFGFSCVRLPHSSFESYLVHLPGHTGGGHSGVAVKFFDLWIFHVGDAYFLEDDLEDEIGNRHLMSEIVQAAISPNTPLRHNTATKISNLKKELRDKLVLISSHEEKNLGQSFSK